MGEIIEAMARAMFESTRESAHTGEPWDSRIAATQESYRHMARAAWNALIEIERADKQRRQKRMGGPFTPISTPFLEAIKRGEIEPG